MKQFLYTLVLISFLGCRHSETKNGSRYQHASIVSEIKSSADSYKVVGVKDGDTFVLLIENNEQVVRLEHIDCPEKKQPFGTKAKQVASDLCFGKFVKLNHKNKYDRNKRLIAEVILKNGVNVNEELVKKGLAWHFKKYSDNVDYAKLEIKARKRRVGVWSEPSPIAPWEWRKMKKKKIK